MATYPADIGIRNKRHRNRNATVSLSVPWTKNKSYGDDMAAITIADGKVLEGALPNKAFELVREYGSPTDRKL